jgi:hypothetical protein
MTMQQSYGGGFVGDFIPPDYNGPQKRVIATAAGGDQSSHSNFFSYPWISGVAKHDSAEPPHDVSADLEPFDQRISMSEAFTFAQGHDSSADIEIPQYRDFQSSGSTQFLTSCPAPEQTITVTSPTAGTNWKGGKTKTITWAQTGLSGTDNVKIELWKGSGSGAANQLLPIVTSVSATAGLNGVPWKVPSSLPAGNGADYWIKITTIGTTPTPVVSDGSGLFTISGVTTQKTGTMTITTTPVDGANIDIPGLTDQLPVLPTTPKTFSNLVPITYFVSVAKNDYYPQGPSPVTVRPGRTIIKTFTLEKVKSGDHPPFGHINVNSDPDGANVFIDGVNRGVTPAETDISPGVHHVYVTKDGYKNSDTQDLTIADWNPSTVREPVNVDFTLTAILDVNAKVLILPQPLNIGRTGYFAAIVTLPRGSKAADVIADTVTCNGATALTLLRAR